MFVLLIKSSIFSIKLIIMSVEFSLNCCKYKQRAANRINNYNNGGIIKQEILPSRINTNIFADSSCLLSIKTIATHHSQVVVESNLCFYQLFLNMEETKIPRDVAILSRQ